MKVLTLFAALAAVVVSTPVSACVLKYTDTPTPYGFHRTWWHDCRQQSYGGGWGGNSGWRQGGGWGGYRPHYQPRGTFSEGPRCQYPGQLNCPVRLGIPW